MSAPSSIWMRVYAPGGVIAPGDLRMIAATSHTLGDGTIRPGLRQDILVPGINPADVKRFRTLVSPLRTVVCGADDPPNVTSSFAAAELGPATAWADSETFHHVIKSFDFQPGLSVNIADPLQELLPVCGSEINLVASGTEDVWHVVLHLPYMRAARHLPVGVESECIAAFVRDVERQVLGEHEPSSQAIAERIRHDWKQGLVDRSDALPPSPATYRGYAGAHAMPNGDGQWYGIGAKWGRFSFGLVDEMGRLAMDQGIAMIGVAPWNAWLVKGVAEAHAAEWKALLTRHGILESPGSADFWLADPRAEREMRWLTVMSAEFAARHSAAPGVSVGIGEFGRDDIAVRIERDARRRGAFWRRETVTVLHREGLDRRAANWVTLGSGLAPADVPTHLARLVASCKANQPAPPPVAESAPEPSREPVYQCPDCLTRYDAKIADPEHGIVAATRFVDVPATWVCPLCETPKAAFAVVT